MSFKMRRICFVILGLCISSLAFPTQAVVQFVPFAEKVTIPCDSYGDGYRKTAKWFHKKDDTAFETIFHSTGYIFQNKNMSSRKRISRNFSLEISLFTEKDKGTYVCQVCTSTNQCTDGKAIILLLQFDTSSTALSGYPFSYSCPYNLTLNATWNFEALGENSAISVNHELTNKNILFIPDVKTINAGKYSYWEETSSGQWQRMCSVTLCVLTVRDVKLTDSPDKCTLYCGLDMDTVEGGFAVVKTDKLNISITMSANKPKSSLRCRLLRSGVETHTFGPEDATATAQSEAISSTTKDKLKNSRPSISAIISISAALIFIISLFVLLCVRRKADKMFCKRGQVHSEEENESQVYSALQLGGAQQNNVKQCQNTDCVYSLIKV